MSIIETKNLSKIYSVGRNQIHALKKINLKIATGEFISVMGPSGSGKSTLLHILGCLDKPTSGEYLLEGKSVVDYDDKSLSRVRSRNFGFVFQTFNLLNHYNLFENVLMPFTYNDMLEEEATKKALKSIEMVGLKHRIDHLPLELSGGEMQRVAIARALVIDPLVIFADEPTGNLDMKTGNEIIDLFEDLNKRGATIIIVTHEKAVARRTRRIIKLVDGELKNAS